MRPAFNDNTDVKISTSVLCISQITSGEMCTVLCFLLYVSDLGVRDKCYLGEMKAISDSEPEKEEVW